MKNHPEVIAYCAAQGAKAALNQLEGLTLLPLSARITSAQRARTAFAEAAIQAYLSINQNTASAVTYKTAP